MSTLRSSPLPPDFDAHAVVVELGGEVVGVAFGERGGIRFAASDHRFWSIDGVRFSSLEKAKSAARRLREGARRTDSSPTQPAGSLPWGLAIDPAYGHVRSIEEDA